MLEIALALGSTFLALAILTWLLPVLLRPLFWVLAHALYRISTYGRVRLPLEGGGLIVCNHTSYVDWLILWVACPRPAKFVLWGSYYRNPILSFFLSWARGHTLRLDERTLRPRAVVEGLKRIAAALDAGQIVVIFPEGTLTRTGNMLPFGRGIERVLKVTTAEIPVIPTAIGGLWGGFFSHAGGSILRKRPRGFRPRVSVWFGKPISKCGARNWQGNRTAGEPPNASLATGVASAGDLRLAVQESIADLAIRESDRIPLVHRAFLRNATKLRYLFRTCIIDNATGQARPLSWGRTLVAALCTMSYLKSRLGDDRNVGVWLPTGLGSALANLALAFMNRTSVNLNYTAGHAPVRSAMRQAGIRFVITSRRFLTRVPLELPEGVQSIYLEDALEAASKWQRIRTFLAVVLLPTAILDRWMLGLHRHRIDDPITIVFSSGSTGEPKGVVLTHRNVGHNVDSCIRTFAIHGRDRLFGILPFFHSFGYTVCLWAPLAAGCSAIFYPDPRKSKEVGELARTHRATLMLATATFLRFYLRQCHPDDFKSVRILVCGAEKLPVKLQHEFHDKFAIRAFEGYGCTELSPVASSNVPDIAAGGLVQKRNRLGTVGQPIFGVCVRAFRIEEGGERTPLPVGEEGVLCAKGPNVMSGYLNQPEKTALAVRDGWYNTGDQGWIEPDGFIRITGRVARFAKIAGEMVPLERLDDEMHELLGGGDRVLAVAAIPDDKRGERLIVLHLPDVECRLEELLEALAKRGLPNLWLPDRRDCYKVESMPALGSGKLDLKKLGELAKELAIPN
jgi:acyl-[acyl-carrier-protein]-phospholipid O-acyltransferase/long-chain-fatty-acid--[acyl-carrier-protein] ligase